ncbi:hypothetical protein HaLaN_24512 [Haematococcus lacustris]|uniref:Uncharacterized protein n=1 Tax=Haematococcus lacustris TaxID=44745 RepID=A0A699ZUK2_HAELA|nr:hypothetical protein HaLaN_24512 [Haematococcus lacustris]
MFVVVPAFVHQNSDHASGFVRVPAPTRPRNVRGATAFISHVSSYSQSRLHWLEVHSPADVVSLFAVPDHWKHEHNKIWPNPAGPGAGVMLGRLHVPKMRFVPCDECNWHCSG